MSVHFRFRINFGDWYSAEMMFE